MRFASTFLIVIFYFSSIGWIWQDFVAKKDKEARKLYSEGKAGDALSKWRDAQIKKPDSEELHYNIGNALHQEKQYKEAFNEYEKILDSKNAELQANTYYNIGNTHYRTGKLPEAIKDYEKCLEINPNDEDAKYNIEFIKKILEQQKQQQEQSGQEKQDKEEKQEDKQQRTKDEGRGTKDEGGEEKEQQKKEGADTEEKEAQEPKTDNRKPITEKEMSEEDAIRLLDALKDDEKKLQKELRMQPVEGRYKVDKDW